MRSLTLERNFHEMEEHEQDQIFAKLAIARIDEALKSENPMNHYKALQVVRDYIWYLVKE